MNAPEQAVTQSFHLDWFMPNSDARKMEAFGLRLSGGGTHLAKTMMLQELTRYLTHSGVDPAKARTLIVDENILEKRTVSARQLSFRHLNALYGVEQNPAIYQVLVGLWPLDPGSRPLLAAICALSRDPIFRDSLAPVLHAPTGTSVRWPVIAEAVDRAHLSRFSPKMLKSLAQNCVSSWTQTGHLQGSVKKVRRRLVATPVAAAYAALIATVCGFGGPALLASAWMRALDISPAQALDLLMRAEALGIAKVRAAGDVTEIKVRRPMAVMLGKPDLEHI